MLIIIEDSQFCTDISKEGVEKGESFDPRDFTIPILPVHNNAHNAAIWWQNLKIGSLQIQQSQDLGYIWQIGKIFDLKYSSIHL